MPDHLREIESERQLSFWEPSLRFGPEVPVMERAYRAVVALLVTSGLRGLGGVRTAQIAEIAGTTESTLFRKVPSRDQLVAQSLDWCWSVVNETISRQAFEQPLPARGPREVILSDVTAVLGMFDDELGRLCGTGALLSFRRSEALVQDFDQVSQRRYVNRLETLCAEVLSAHDTSPVDPSIVAAFFTNAVATAWFTWLFDSASRGRGGLLSPEFVLHGIDRYLDDLTAGRFVAAPQ